MEDVVVVDKILCSMAPKYNYIVCSIEKSKDVNMFPLDEHQSSLKASFESFYGCFFVKFMEGEITTTTMAEEEDGINILRKSKLNVINDTNSAIIHLNLTLS
ncbi:hypothetical protein CR513_43863, partial [Mucuna pruriens]